MSCEFILYPYYTLYLFVCVCVCVYVYISMGVGMRRGWDMGRGRVTGTGRCGVFQVYLCTSRENDIF